MQLFSLILKSDLSLFDLLIYKYTNIQMCSDWRTKILLRQFKINILLAVQHQQSEL